VVVGVVVPPASRCLWNLSAQAGALLPVCSTSSRSSVVQLLLSCK
jgi:hypothetical protein